MLKSEWTFPLKVVEYGSNLDQNMNAFYQVADAKNRSCFYVRIDGRERGAHESLKSVVASMVEHFNEKYLMENSVQAPMAQVEPASPGYQAQETSEVKPGRASKPDAYYQEIADYVDAGNTLSETAKKFKLGKGYVYQIHRKWSAKKVAA